MNWISNLLSTLKLQKRAIYHFIVFPLIILAFITYWVTTFFFALPDNYINIKHTYSKFRLNIFLNQNWHVFASAPKYNFRVYYIFESISDSTHLFTYEIIEPLMKNKRAKAPFNYEESLLDNLLINSIKYIEHQSIELNQDISYINYVNSSNNNKHKLKLESYPVFQENSTVKNLINYSKTIAVNNNFSLKNKYVRIRITKAQLTPFSERHQQKKQKEVLFYESKRIRF